MSLKEGQSSSGQPIDYEKKIESSSLRSTTAEEGEVLSLESKEWTVKRELAPRNLQMIAIGGSIGTVLFLTISTGLLYSGPGSLLLAFVFWCFVVYFVCLGTGEMTCYLPVDSPFIQMAGRCVDRSFEFSVGMNYFLMTSTFIPFEITAVNSMIHYWRDDYSPAITFACEIVIYISLNIFAVRWFGQSEFYLSLGKLLLALALLFFTFITMVGGNPKHDAYGFRYWRDPGPFAEYLDTGNVGRMHGFLAAMNKAALTIVGPEYLCMLAGETGGETRKVLARTFRSVIIRLCLFYIFGALCVGIVIAYNDPTLVRLASTSDTSNGNYSPYVIAMGNLDIEVFPHIVNALCITSAFSAGNSFVFCSSRALFGMAQRGMVPKIFKTCTRTGIPVYCIGVTFCFSLLSLLQLGSTSGDVLNWLVNLATGGQLINYFTMCITYLQFRKAYIVQGVDRSAFPFKSKYQPFLTYFAMFFLFCMIFLLGYTNFLPGNWDIESFLTYYLFIFVFIVNYCGHKLITKSQFVSPEEADLITGMQEIEEHEMNYLEEFEKSGFVRKWYHKVYDFIFM